MAKSQDLSDPASITAFIQKLEPAFAETIETLRQIIMGTDKSIGEHIKWNHPTFFYTGEMKLFSPKEYKREIVVTNFHKGRILLVFPSGAKLNDKTGFLEGNYPDGRRVVYFKDLADVKARSKQLQKVIKDWLKLVDK